MIPVFIWAPEEDGKWPAGGASRWWLHQSLGALHDELKAHKSRLIIRTGPTLEALREIIADTGADGVFFNRLYEPDALQRDEKIAGALEKDGIECESFNGSLLFEPGTVLNKSDRPFQVFTPFWKTCLKKKRREVLPEPRQLAGPSNWPSSTPLRKLELEPKVDWAEGLDAKWEPGSRGAAHALDRFIKHALADYEHGRNRVDIVGSSELSPHLHFGEITPEAIWKAVDDARRIPQKAAGTYLSEIGWREFAHHLLFHFPDTPRNALRENFRDFPWTNSRKNLRRWQEGQTGFPIVDAAMRHLWAEGWMPNRARMIVASFLTKHLLIHWRKGAEWFWDTLVDADLASNTLGWQWTAGCGADAAPYFRIFNPILQAEKFDPDGDYIRLWIPEIATLDKPWIFKPWEAPDDVLDECGIKLGKDYPKPVVDHADARDKALAAYDQVRASA